MPERLTSLEIPLDVSDVEAALREAAAARLRVPPARLVAVEVVKRSLDARRRRQAPVWIFTAEVWLDSEVQAYGAHIEERERKLSPGFPALLRPGRRAPVGRWPIVIGTGPAGLFAALTYVDHGVPCLLLDRGKPLHERHVDVRRFRRSGELDPESNLCFGEGGAGTYSDGKLYTRKHHPLVRTVYERLVAFGAVRDILLEAHPHVGTNKLYAILEAIRSHLLERGCEIRFGAKTSGLLVREGRVLGVELASGEEVLGSPVVLATGHSARDTIETLVTAGVPFVAKPFAVGARCEHPQELIDQIQLGDARRHPQVGAAEYFLSCNVGTRAVYSFCMCPGGYVIPTPTEPGHLNVNGMSNSNRGADFANAALVVTVQPSDYWVAARGDLDHLGVLSGIAFQREWERRAFEAGGSSYRAPAQRLTDFVRGESSGALPGRTSYRPGLEPFDLAALLPQAVIDTLRQGVRELDRRMRGFLTDEAVLIGVETTTSSPLRMVRGEDRQSPGFSGLYPCGEGAGYSGGIVSSAIEGIETAVASLQAFFPE